MEARHVTRGVDGSLLRMVEDESSSGHDVRTGSSNIVGPPVSADACRFGFQPYHGGRFKNEMHLAV